MLIEKRAFTNGMDGDTNTRELPANVMLNLMNARVGVTENGRDLRIENVPGTTQITQSVYPPYGTDQCIGSCVDEANSRILYAICNTSNDNGIYCYDINSGITYAVLYDSQVIGGLGFSKLYRIDRNMKVVGNMLYWTDNLSNPRRINYIAGIKMNHPSFSTTVTPYSWPMNQSVIAWIRRPYGLAVTATKANAGGFANNFIAEFSGQFASAFIYRDGEETVASVPCDMVNFNYPTDTYNFIQITFPLTETFDQDVQVIQLLVRFNNSPDYFIIKEWNKSNATDLAAINAHNSGSTNLTYNFYNNTQGIPFGKDKSVKPSDSIGLTVKTIEFADNKMFHANYVKGYNTPATTSLSASLSSNGSDPTYAMQLKANGSYQIGIRFRDNYKRSIGFVVTNSNCVVTNTDRSYSTLPYNSIAWLVSNAAATAEIPVEAVYYDILVTKCLTSKYFLQNQAVTLRYAIKNPNGTYSYTNIYGSNVYGIAVNISYMVSVGYGYLANTDDLCRLYLSSTATVYERQVLALDGDQLIIKAQDIGNLNTPPACIFEIYTPYFKSEFENFYTTGQSYKVTNPGTGSRQYSTVSGIITGDVVRYKPGGFRNEIMSPSITRQNLWLQFYGESNKQSTLGQVNKKDFICWSNTRIEGAQVNGLCTFDALAEKAIPDVGEINKLQLANKVSDMGQGNVMLAICPLEISSMYLGQTEVLGASKTLYLAQTTDTIGSVNTLTGSLGSVNPESIIQYLGLVFGYDATNGVWWQYSPAGLEPISRYKMSRFFARYSKDYLAASTGNLDNINGFHHVPSGIDPFNKELVCGMPGLIYQNYANTLPSYSSVPSYATSIIDRFDIYDQLQKDMIFCFEKNFWGRNFNYGCEWYEYSANKMYGWKNGVMWTFNTNTTNWNTFCGVQQPVRVCFTGNINPSALKVLNNIAVEGNTIPNFTVAMADYPNTQITDLASTDTDIDGNLVWTNQEGNFYATFFMDRLSPNSSIGGTADQKLYTGDPITDIAIKVMLEFQAYTSLIFINYVDLGYEVAKGQKQITNPINT